MRPSPYRSALLVVAASLASTYLGQSAAAPARVTDAEYARRRMSLLEQAGPESLVLVADNEHEDLGRAGASFRYLTGFSAPGAILLLNYDPDKPKAVAIAFADGARTEVRAFWRGKTLPDSEIEAWIRKAADRGAPLFASERLRPRVQRVVGDATIHRVERPIHRLRSVKSQAELALSKKAIEITIKGHLAAAQTCRPQQNERDLEKAIVEAFRKHGSTQNAFPCIVGSGPNSCIPHYFDNNRAMASGDLVVVDIGAEYGDYAADLTRTYPVSGAFTPRQLQLYSAVLEAQRAAERAAQPGASLGDLDRAARGSLRSSALRAKKAGGEEATLDAFFTHGIGHSIGLEVHDPMPDGPIPVGALFTIEPGVYIESESIGIRIEDNYLMTEKGAVKLSSSLPSEAKEVERWMVQQASKASTRKPN